VTNLGPVLECKGYVSCRETCLATHGANCLTCRTQTFWPRKNVCGVSGTQPLDNLFFVVPSPLMQLPQNCQTCACTNGTQLTGSNLQGNAFVCRLCSSENSVTNATTGNRACQHSCSQIFDDQLKNPPFCTSLGLLARLGPSFVDFGWLLFQGLARFSRCCCRDRP
jgi:hypothetical protein